MNAALGLVASNDDDSYVITINMSEKEVRDYVKVYEHVKQEDLEDGEIDDDLLLLLRKIVNKLDEP